MADYTDLIARLPASIERLADHQPLDSNLGALAQDPRVAIESFGPEWAGRCAASAADALQAQATALVELQAEVERLSKPTNALHEWVHASAVGLTQDWVVCRQCGIIQNTLNKCWACKGKVRVSLRDESQADPVALQAEVERKDKALREIYAKGPSLEPSTYGPRFRCLHCGHAWPQEGSREGEHHAPHCAYVTACAALAEVPKEQG